MPHASTPPRIASGRSRWPSVCVASEDGRRQQQSNRPPFRLVRQEHYGEQCTENEMRSPKALGNRLN